MECILCKNDSTIKLCDLQISDLCALYASWLTYDVLSEFEGIELINFLECRNCGLKFFYPPVTGSQQYYDAISKSMGNSYYQEAKSEYMFSSNFIGDNDYVLDIGSGGGRFSKFVRGKYLGIDFNPSAIEIARAEGINVINESIEEHANKISFSYSVITAFQVIEHIADPSGFIKSCLKVLKIGGLLIFSVPSEDSFVSLQDNAVLNMPPHHISRWNNNVLLNIGKIFNLTLMAMEHEMLSKIHFESFMNVIANTTIREMLKWKKRTLIDTSIKQRLVNKLSNCLKPIYRRVFANTLLWPKGHSVTAVYRKDS